MLPLGTDIRLKQGLPKMTAGLIVFMGILEFIIAPIFPDHRDYNQLMAMGFGEGYQVWGPLTYMFSHASIGHYIGNMIFLWIFGAPLEDRLGPRDFLYLYIVCGFASAILHFFILSFWLPWPVPGVIGASGSISGIMGLCAARFSKGRVKLWLGFTAAYFFRRIYFKVPLVALVAVYLYFDIKAGLGPHSRVAHWGHIGGMLAGLVLAKFMKLQGSDYGDLLLADAQEDLEAGRLHAAHASFTRLYRMGRHEMAVRRGLALSQGVALRRLRAPDPAQMAEAARHLEVVIADMLSRPSEQLEAIKLYRDWAPFFGEEKFGLKFRDQLKQFQNLASEANLRPMDGSEREQRILQASQGLRQAAREHDHAAALAQAKALEALSEAQQWAPELILAAGLAAAHAGQRKQALDWLPLVVRQGDVDQCMAALLAIEKFVLNTPAQADLARYGLQAKNRWDYKIEERQDWIDLQARMKRV